MEPVVDYYRALEAYRQRWLAIDELSRRRILREQRTLREELTSA